MSAAPQFPYPREERREQAPPSPPRRPLWKRLLLWIGGGLLVLIVLIVAAVFILLHNRSFHNYVLRTAQQKATAALGANVHIQEFALNFSGISPTLDVYGVVVDGAPPYLTPPLLQVQHARAAVRITSLLHRNWYLSEVAVDHPVVQAFVDKQGKSNLPTPEKKSQSNSNTSIFDLGVRHAVLDQGEVYYNDRKSVLDADLDDVTFNSHFDTGNQSYAGSLSYQNGHLRMSTFNTIPHQFHADFVATRETFTLRNAVLRSGRSSFTLNATVEDYSNPKINADYRALLDTAEFRRIMKNPSLPVGIIEAGGNAQYQEQSNVPLMKGAVVSGNLRSPALLVETPQMRTTIRDLGANFALRNGNLDVRDMHAALLGGVLNGTLVMTDIAGNSNSHLQATLKGVSLAQAKALMNSPGLQNISLTGTVNADADARWGKTMNDLAATSNATIQASLRSGQSAAVPLNGVIHARYSAPAKLIALRDSYIRTPQTSINLNGTVSDRSALAINVQSNDLHEIETLADMFQTAKPGQPVQPLGLYGTASFQGQVTGSTSAPHLTGQLTAQNLRVKGSSWRLLRTGVDASPSQASLLNGELAPAGRGNINFNLRTALAHWSFTPASPFNASLNAKQLDLANLSRAAGMTTPIQGNLSADVQLHGTERSPVGQGSVNVTQAKVSGETIQSANVQFQGTGDTVHAKLGVRMPAGVANAVLTYYPPTQGYEAQLKADGIQLNQFQAVKAKNLQLQGVLNLEASGRGTLKDPQLNASLRIPSLVVQNQKINGISLQANVANHVANVALDSQAINTSIRGRATVNLSGEYQTTASLDTQAIPFAPLVAAYAPDQAGNITGQTELHATVRGPLKNKQALEAHVTIPTLAMNYKNTVQIAAPQPIHLDYANGVLNLQRAALKGTDTDLQFQGRVPVMDRTAPVSLLLLGTVDLKLMQLVDPDYVTSGQLRFDINSYGQLANPNVEGQVRVVEAAFATGDMPLGLSHGNGVLTLTRDRLEITEFTGKLGSGDVSASGAVHYRPNVEFDLAMQGKGIHLLYPAGVRSAMGMNMTLTGTMDSANLRGQVNLYQLSFTPDFDLQDMMGQMGGTTEAPPSEGFSNNLQLDIAVRTPNGIDLSSRQLSLAGAMNMNITGSAAQPVLLGRINMTGGDFLFNNERFVLQGGTIDFVNPSVTQPVLNVSVNTTVQQYNIAMRFEGPVDHMRTSYTSEPALPPADIIHLIAFGSTTEAAAANPSPPGNLAAEQKVASAVSSQVTSRVAKIAGLSQLSVDPTLGGTGSSSGPGAVITVQQRVTSKIFVTFSTDVTSTQNQVIQLEYKKSPRFSVSGTRDQNGGVAFDTKMHKVW